MRRLLIVLALVACGDNLGGTGPALQRATELVVVAHQDDDLLLMQPDVLEAVQRREGVTLVYVTAGNGRSTDAGEHRNAGLRAAYGYALGSDDWRCGWIEIEGHAVQHCRLEHVSLVFLGYPDGGKQGEYPGSLLELWEGRVASVQTLGERTTHYDRPGLIATVAEIMRTTQPAIVRTLEVAATHGRDHYDHMLVGALTMLAMAQAQSRAELLSYRGYAINGEPANKLPPIYDASLALLARYTACTDDCDVACGEPCSEVSTTHTEWLQRRYAVGFPRSAAGRLRSGTDCLDENLVLVSCTNAPSWRFDEHGQLQNADKRCLVVADSGAIELADCLGGSERRFFLDDEGHLWSSVPPPHQLALDYAHLSCLAPTATGVALQICGADRAPTWQFVPRTVETSRASIGFFATGREVRLGDLTGDGRADLCAIDNGLYCAPGDGRGGFAAAIRLDVGVPLDIDPKSLTLGDVDGDDALDACGRNTGGVLCATAASQLNAMAWSSAFADPLARTGTSASLAAIDANADGIADICGVDRTGVVCAPRGGDQTLMRSTWPASAAVVWPADLDGDRQADWCAATDAGPACAVEAQRELTTDGAPWGFASAGIVDVAPENTATVALADIDGDGRADLCAPREDRILCARSQGRAFGPRTLTLAILPNQSTASALWLGDLDGDGRADACADTGTTITCAVEP